MKIPVEPVVDWCSMGHGFVIVGSRYSQAAEELVVDDVHVRTFYPDQLETSRKAIHQLLVTTTEERLSMGEAARQAALRWSPEIVGNIFLSVIKAVRI